MSVVEKMFYLMIYIKLCEPQYLNIPVGDVHLMEVLNGCANVMHYLRRL